MLKSFVADESGATAVEYGLIVALIFLAIVGAVQSAGGAVGAVYVVIAAAIAG
ncbi:MAG: Flp family type IVb pilin [Alphaproteobacteria bacterium]|nr:Flp family type IVb pilin [Alphaproteobacteria bacterium]